MGGEKEQANKDPRKVEVVMMIWMEAENVRSENKDVWGQPFFPGRRPRRSLSSRLPLKIVSVHRAVNPEHTVNQN